MISRARLGRALATGLLALGGCRTTGTQKDLPAVIVNPTAQSREALSRAVSATLGGAPVTLAADALTARSELVVERSRARDPRGLPANGRELAAPERFRLVKSGGDCVLVRERDGERATLPATACAPR
ncbi:MAG: hypothetical protein ACJ79R_05315 [Anaeromyxobacteraceae bacterium]